MKIIGKVFIVVIAVLLVFSTARANNFSTGMLFYDKKAYEKAIEYFKASKHDYRYFYVGKSYRYLDQPKDAIEYFERYLKEASFRERDHIATMINITYSYVSLGDAEKAVESIEVILDSNIFKGDIAYAAATAYNVAGFKKMKSVIDKSSKQKLALYNDAIALFEKGQARYRENRVLNNNKFSANYQAMVLAKKLRNKSLYDKYRTAAIKSVQDYPLDEDVSNKAVSELEKVKY